MTEAARDRIRRPPPPFRTASVLDVATVGPRLRRVTLAGPALVGFPVPLPAASVRLLLPSSGTTQLVLPGWNGNEFLLPDGRRPVLRTFTPRAVDPDAGTLTVEIVRHGHGAASAWVTEAAPGAPVAVSGPGRGYTIDHDVHAFVLAGDETAIPAIAQLLEQLPHDVAVRAHIELAAADGRVPLPEHPGADVTWHELTDAGDPGATLVAAVGAEELELDTRVWVAGEAASVQRIRRDLFETRGFPRAHATVRGYWKRGRTGDGDA